MQHEVHAADAEHGHARVAVVAGEGLGLREFPLFLGLSLLPVRPCGQPSSSYLRSRGSVWVSRRCCQALTRKPQVPAAGSQMRSPGLAGRSSCTIMRMMWRGVRNWPFGASGVEAAEQVLVEIALHVLVLRGDLHLVDGLAGLDEQARLVDLEFGVRHVLAEGAGLRAELLEEGKYFFFDDA